LAEKLGCKVVIIVIFIARMTVVVAVVAAAGDRAKKKDSNMKNTMFDSYSFVVTIISTTKKRLNYVILFQTKLMLHHWDLCYHY